MVAPSPRRVRSAHWLFGVVALGAVVAVALHAGEARTFGRLLVHARPPWLAAGVVLQAATYACLAGIWRVVLARSSTRRTLRNLIPLALAKLFTDQAVPSAGLSGNVVVVRGLERRDIPPPLAVAAVLVQLFGFHLAFAIAVATSLFLLYAAGHLTPVLVTMAAVFAVVVATIPAALLLVSLTSRRVPSGVARFPGVGATVDALRHASRKAFLDAWAVGTAALLELAIIVLDAATLGAMLAAVGARVAPEKVFATLVVALVAETMGPTPGGLGAFEGASIAMLRVWGVPLEHATAATLLLRGLTFWLPMLPGMVVARAELAARRGPT